jgi:hypothetical protein
MKDEVVKSYESIESNVEKKMNSRIEIINRRGNSVIPRKYHLTDVQFQSSLNRWKEFIKDVPLEIRNKVSSSFFNPYRDSGAYFGAVQALFLLGGNEWHSFMEVRKMMQKDMSSRKSSVGNKTSWEKFALKGAREGAIITKDLMGRIVHNFKTLQRLGGIHPYGHKLKQALSSVDIKREVDGIYYFRLNTSFKTTAEVLPFYDVSSFKKPRKVKKLKIVPLDQKAVVVSDEAVSSD